MFLPMDTVTLRANGLLLGIYHKERDSIISLIMTLKNPQNNAMNAVPQTSH